jgi:hypothetical protein
MRWFAVRALFKFGIKSDGKTVIEERIVCFRADDAEEGLERAVAESDLYAAQTGIQEVHDQFDVFELDGESLIDAYEIWSHLFETHLSLSEFFDEHFLKCRYHPE